MYYSLALKRSPPPQPRGEARQGGLAIDKVGSRSLLLSSLPPSSSLHTTEESFQVLSYNAQWHEDELSQVNVVVGPALKETALEHVQKKLNTIPLHDSSVL